MSIESPSAPVKAKVSQEGRASKKKKKKNRKEKEKEEENKQVYVMG